VIYKPDSVLTNFGTLERRVLLGAGIDQTINSSIPAPKRTRSLNLPHLFKNPMSSQLQTVPTPHIPRDRSETSAETSWLMAQV
jgi:hypothetical protein